MWRKKLMLSNQWTAQDTGRLLCGPLWNGYPDKWILVWAQFEITPWFMPRARKLSLQKHTYWPFRCLNSLLHPPPPPNFSFPENHTVLKIVLFYIFTKLSFTLFLYNCCRWMIGKLILFLSVLCLIIDLVRGENFHCAWLTLVYFIVMSSRAHWVASPEWDVFNKMTHISFVPWNRWWENFII